MSNLYPDMMRESPPLESELWDILEPYEPPRLAEDGSYIFAGRLQRDPDLAFQLLKERFRPYGYTPLLRRHRGKDLVLAVPGLSSERASSGWAVPLVLLVATLVTTTGMGTLLAGGNPLKHAADWRLGMPFSFGLLTILGVHELGHYIAARRHGIAVTVPYFIPVPLGLGTFGAFIQLRSPVETRRALFDVGIAGPLAGLLAAVPIFALGLTQSALTPAWGSDGLGRSLLVEALVQWIRPHGEGYAILLHPLALAGWFGLLVTGFNLLPAGQLDGGHIAQAVLGRHARWLSVLMLAALFVMGWLYWPGWFVWAFFVALTSLRQPTPLNELSSLDGSRAWVALLGLAILTLTFTPVPF